MVPKIRVLRELLERKASKSKCHNWAFFDFMGPRFSCKRQKQVNHNLFTVNNNWVYIITYNNVTAGKISILEGQGTSLASKIFNKSGHLNFSKRFRFGSAYQRHFCWNPDSAKTAKSAYNFSIPKFKLLFLTNCWLAFFPSRTLTAAFYLCMTMKKKDCQFFCVISLILVK